MLLFSTFLLWLCEANKRKSSFQLKAFSTHEKTVPFAFYFVNQKEFQTSMWFVLTELVVKCGNNTEQLQFITKEDVKKVAAIFKLTLSIEKWERNIKYEFDGNSKATKLNLKKNDQPCSHWWSSKDAMNSLLSWSFFTSDNLKFQYDNRLLLNCWFANLTLLFSTSYFSVKSSNKRKWKILSVLSSIKYFCFSFIVIIIGVEKKSLLFVSDDEWLSVCDYYFDIRFRFHHQQIIMWCCAVKTFPFRGQQRLLGQISFQKASTVNDTLAGQLKTS